MKKLGYLMITVGFLAGSLVAIVDKEHVRWAHFSAAMAVGVAGVAFVRTSQRRKSKAEGELVSSMEFLEASLNRIVENITRLNAEKLDINTYDVRHQIDELFIEDLTTFVQARESIAHAYGLAVYGDVMSSFAAGERYLNRVWSASADGYIDEVNTYIDKAREQFVESLDKIRQLKLNA